MPLIVYLRQNYLFQLGICEFWNKFMDYVLDLESKVILSSDEKFSFGRESNTARNVLILIPGGGLLLCLLTFLSEIRIYMMVLIYSAKEKVIKWFANFFGNLKKGYTKKATKSKEKVTKIFV